MAGRDKSGKLEHRSAMVRAARREWIICVVSNAARLSVLIGAAAFLLPMDHVAHRLYHAEQIQWSHHDRTHASAPAL
jgi:hypothetical protein